MGDTLQLVRWALERSCPYRQGEDWPHPERACDQLFDLSMISHAAERGDVVNGICVTAYSMCSPFKNEKGKTDYDRSVYTPSSGFRVAERLAPFGGLDSVAATCGGCEVNLAADRKLPLAGCHGSLFFDPDSKELDELLHRSLADLDLRAEFRESIQETSPLWYGLWIGSPLRRQQAHVLQRLFQHAFAAENESDDPLDESEQKNVEHFLRALTVAASSEVSLHVAFLPPGHVDLGWHTVFPHCPRCKANAGVGCWKESYPQVDHVCKVCGNHFVPDENHSRERDDFDGFGDSLDELLGQQAFQQLERDYCLAHGYTSEQIDIIWQDRLDRKRKAEEWARENRERKGEPMPFDPVEEPEPNYDAPLLPPFFLPPCPLCGKPLRTTRARQCFESGADWH